MLTRKLIDQAMFRACGRTRREQRGGENATIELRKKKTGKKNEKRVEGEDGLYTRGTVDENWESGMKATDKARVAVRDDHDKSRRPFSRGRDSVYLPLFFILDDRPFSLTAMVHTHIHTDTHIQRSALILVCTSGRFRCNFGFFPDAA